MLTVMSDMDPHMIIGTWDWIGLVRIGLVWFDRVKYV
jgi:hypothetical protein